MSDVMGDGQDVVIGEIKQHVLSYDAFKRYRVSNTRHELEFNAYHDILFDANRRLFAKSEASGATITHSTTTRSYTVASGTTSGATAIAQSKLRTKYHPGRSQLIILSFIMKAGATNTIKRLGYFDDQDGLYLQQSGSTVSFNVRNSITGSTTTINQSSWNDPLDGTGDSGITIDWTKSQIMIIDFQWIGAGRINLYFDIDDKLVLAHTIYNANRNAGLYMASGSLPLRYEISNSSASAGANFEFYCGVVLSEGGESIADEFGTSFSAATTGAGRNVNTTGIPLISIRPTANFKGEANKSIIYPALFGIFSATRDFQVSIYYNTTLTGASWTAITDSAAEYDISATAITGGRMIASLPQDSTSAIIFQDLLNNEWSALDLNGNQPVLTVFARTLSNTSIIAAGLSWKEVYR